MTQEERIFKGLLYAPGDQALRAMKLKSHNLSQEYSQTFEHEVEKRSENLSARVGSSGFFEL